MRASCVSADVSSPGPMAVNVTNEMDATTMVASKTLIEDATISMGAVRFLTFGIFLDSGAHERPSGHWTMMIVVRKITVGNHVRM